MLNFDWLLFMKRIGNVCDMFNEVVDELFYGFNMWDELVWLIVWFGVMIVNQGEVDCEILKLFVVLVCVCFLSMEFLFGLVSFDGMFISVNWCDCINVFEELDWLIVGGESGCGVWLIYLDWVCYLCD